MKRFFKNLFILLALGSAASVYATPPTFNQNIADHLISGTPDSQGRVESVFNLQVDPEKSLFDNIVTLFYPSFSSQSTEYGAGGRLRDVLRTLGFGIMLIFLVRTGIQILLDARDGEKARGHLMSLVYIIGGAVIFFASTWILGIALNIDGSGGSERLTNAIQNNLAFQVLTLLKSAAFFMAIIIMIRAGFRIIMAQDKEDKLKAAKALILNIIIALAFIKMIDYVYFIAQADDFKNRASEIIVEISKVLGYILGASFTLAVIYSGIVLITSGGDDSRLNTVKSVLSGIFLAAIVIFLFLLITYQIFQEFA